MKKGAVFKKEWGEQFFNIAVCSYIWGLCPGGGLRPLGSWNAREDGGRVRRGEKHECN